VSSLAEAQAAGRRTWEKWGEHPMVRNVDVVMVSNNPDEFEVRVDAYSWRVIGLRDECLGVPVRQACVWPIGTHS
jgi:hypothetical protein